MREESRGVEGGGVREKGGEGCVMMDEGGGVREVG